MARRTVLDHLYWELTYWKTPDEYERLTAGEQVHLGALDVARVDGTVVLDAGAGTGRITLDYLLSRAAAHAAGRHGSDGCAAAGWPLRALESALACTGLAPGLASKPGFVCAQRDGLEPQAQEESAMRPGGPERIRTSDTRFRKPPLYPLSYGAGMRVSPQRGAPSAAV